MRYDPNDPRSATEQERAQRTIPFRATDTQIERARDLRQSQSPPEGILWSRLRAGKLGGFKFRRQHPIDGITVDFYCHEALLAVEIDGLDHRARARADRWRDEHLERHGIVTMRVIAGLIGTKDLPLVLGSIERMCRKRMAELEEARRAGGVRGEVGRPKMG